MKKTTILSILLAVALLATSLPALSCQSPFIPSEADKQTLQDLPPDFLRLSQAWQVLQKYYVDQKGLDPVKLAQGAVRGMVQAVGDPYTEYFSPQVYQSTIVDYIGQYQGIGAYLGKKDNWIVVIAPMPDSPAEKAGLKAGDYILKIDGVSTDNMTSDEASLKIRGPAGSKVTLTVGRQGEKEPLAISIQRQEIKVASIKSEMHGQIAYIRIQQFLLPTIDDFKKALQDSFDKGAKGVVLDLRDNPGGLLDEAIDVASQFLVRGIVVKVVDRNGIENVKKVESGGMALNAPLIVLVNGGSASASEIVAGALQDNGRAKLAGTKTFGKAAVQNFIKLDDGSAIKVTVAHYYTPNGTLISGTGLKPDYATSLLGDNLTDWAVDYLNAIIAGKPVQAPPPPASDNVTSLNR